MPDEPFPVLDVSLNPGSGTTMDGEASEVQERGGEMVPRVAVIGLGKLGAVMAGVFAASGLDTIGVDIDQFQVDAINNGSVGRISEPGFADLLDGPASTLRATTDLATVMAERDLAMIIVPTPSDRDGRFDPSLVVEAIRALAPGIAHRAQVGGYPVVCVCSTVMPGDCEKVIRPALEAATGLEVGRSCGLSASPEFVALGDVIHGMQHPDMLIVGASDSRTAEVVEAAYRDVHNAPRIRLSLTETEVAKLAVNTYLSMKIAWANHVASVCSLVGLGDTSARAVCATVGVDHRIGRSFLQPGLPASGPCLKRDMQAWIALAGGDQADSPLTNAVQMVNARRLRELVNECVSAVAGCSENHHWDVAVLGLAYKAGTPVVEGSETIGLIERLDEHGLSVVVCDPAAVAPEGLPAKTEHVPHVAVGGAAVTVVMTREPLWRSLGLKAGACVIDPWGWLA